MQLEHIVPEDLSTFYSTGVCRSSNTVNHLVEPVHKLNSSSVAIRIHCLWQMSNQINTDTGPAPIWYLQWHYKTLHTADC